MKQVRQRKTYIISSPMWNLKTKRKNKIKKKKKKQGQAHKYREHIGDWQRWRLGWWVDEKSKGG